MNTYMFSKTMKPALVVILLLQRFYARAQDGSAGIQEANSLVRQYFDVGINLMYAVGAVLGLIGAVRVYQRWSSGDPHTGQIAASWFGSCIFLVIVATVLRSFFGL
ncbi:DUF4134 domain-containing protein [Niabella ginsengisoli]